MLIMVRTIKDLINNDITLELHGLFMLLQAVYIQQLSFVLQKLCPIT